ncbi:MAG: sigma-70 family RNA polymerase sigma factor [Planctomycetota bacterium]
MTHEEQLKTWMRAISAGDGEALSALFEATKNNLFGLILRTVGTRESAEEVLTDAYVQVWRRAGLYDPRKGSVMVWLMTLARRRAIDRLRSMRSLSALPGSLPSDDLDEKDEPEAPGPTPLQTSLVDERAGEVRDAVDELTHDQRRAIEAIFFQGLTHTQASEALGQPLGTLKSRVRSGLLVLRQRLERKEGAV